MKSFVLPIAIGLILAAFGWWLNQDRYDVKYTLSEKIPLSFEGAQQEAVQQLEVKNLSNKGVESVQVKLPQRITKHELVKNSQADKAEIFINQNSFELLYAALPPQGSFRLVLKTTGDGISKTEVQVRHSRGRAEEALADASSLKSIFTWVNLGFALFYLWVILINLRNLSVDSWKSDTEYRSEKVLRASKPIHIPLDKWKEIREKAISKFGEFDRYGPLTESDITNSLIYKSLNSDKPENLSAEEWQRFRHVKTKEFLAAFVKRMTESWTSSDQILKLLRVKKPIQIPSDEWEELQDKLQEHFITSEREKIPFYSITHSDLIAKIQQPKPDEISSNRWTKYQDWLSATLFKSLSTELETEDSPLEYVGQQHLEALKYDDVQRLQKRAYTLQLAAVKDLSDENNAQRFLRDAKPSWMSEDDYLERKAIAEKTLRVAEQDVTNSIVRSTIDRILANAPLDIKAIERLDPELRQELKKLDEQIRLSKDTNTIERERISKESDQVTEVKIKVLKQLDILQKLLVDPESIDRLEPYDNPFASGNLELLKSVSIALRRKA
jgi:hypothetical protein